MKNRFISLRLLAVAAVAGGLSVVPARAQLAATAAPVIEATDAAAQWEKLQRVNAAAQSIHVVWHCVRRLKARPDADPEAQAQATMKAAREDGLDEKKVAQFGEVARKSALDSQKERVIETTFDFVRIGNSVLCNAVYPAPELSERFIEFSDGTDAIHAVNEFKGEIRRPSGVLMRDPQEILYMSATGPQVARLMLAIPFDQEFGPSNPVLSPKEAKLRRLKNGEWLVERQTRDQQNTILAPNTLTFGGDGAYLAGYEEFFIKSFLMDKDQKIEKIDYESAHKIVGSEFKQYADGIWFPSRIVRSSPNETYEYSLIEVQFNDDVNPLGLTLPPDLRVTDTRFGKGLNAAVYTTTEGRLMTDEEVKRNMLGR